MWRNDLRWGKGEYTTNKERLVGTWQNDLLEGLVDIYYRNEIQRVRFDRGRPVLDFDQIPAA